MASENEWTRSTSDVKSNPEERKEGSFLLPNLHLKVGVVGAAVSGMIIGGNEICSGASGVASMADSGRAAAAGLAGLDSEAVLGELGVAFHVDAREVPEDGW